MTGLEFKKIRDILRLSQKEMGKKMGLTQTQISRIEKTENDIKDSTSILANRILKDFQKVPQELRFINSNNNQQVIQTENVSSMINIASNSAMEAIDLENQEIFDLFKTYATPKIKKELKEKLLAIKALDDK